MYSGVAACPSKCSRCLSSTTARKHEAEWFFNSNTICFWRHVICENYCDDVCFVFLQCLLKKAFTSWTQGTVHRWEITAPNQVNLCIFSLLMKVSCLYISCIPHCPTDKIFSCIPHCRIHICFVTDHVPENTVGTYIASGISVNSICGSIVPGITF